MNNGYIKLHRKILDNPIAQKASYAWLWVTLLLKANHKENKFMWNGNIIIVKEGQLLTGRKELSEQTGIPGSTIEDILNFLEKQHQIRQQTTTKFRLITIINWKDYQNSDNNSDNKATTKRQQSDTNKNDKNEKKYIAETSSAQIPFNFDETINKWINGEDRAYQLIARYLKLKKVKCETYKQLQTIAKRHLRSARQLTDFSDKQIQEAINKIATNKELLQEFTLETIIKYLSK